MIKWNKVTWYSKLGAVIVIFGILPALSFYIGVLYAGIPKYIVIVQSPNYTDK